MTTTDAAAGGLPGGTTNPMRNVILMWLSQLMVMSGFDAAEISISHGSERPFLFGSGAGGA